MIGHDGASLLPKLATTMNSLIAAGGGNIISPDGASLIAQNAAAAVAQTARDLVAFNTIDTASLIQNNAMLAGTRTLQSVDSTPHLQVYRAVDGSPKLPCTGAEIKYAMKGKHYAEPTKENRSSALGFACLSDLKKANWTPMQTASR